MRRCVSALRSFDREYAAVLGKAADVAANSTRKTAAKV
jgi:hypothetical protein